MTASHPHQASGPSLPSPEPDDQRSDDDSDWESEAIADALLGRQSHPNLLIGPTATSVPSLGSSISPAASCLEEGQVCEDELDTTTTTTTTTTNTIHHHPNTLTPINPDLDLDHPLHLHHHHHPSVSITLLDRLGLPSQSNLITSSSSSSATTRRGSLKLEPSDFHQPLSLLASHHQSQSQDHRSPKSFSLPSSTAQAQKLASRTTPNRRRAPSLNRLTTHSLPRSPKRSRHSPPLPPPIPPPPLPSSSSSLSRRRRASLSSRIAAHRRRGSCSPIRTRHELPPKPLGAACRSTSPSQSVHQIIPSDHADRDALNPVRSNTNPSINPPRNRSLPELHPPSQPQPASPTPYTPTSATNPPTSHLKDFPRSNNHNNNGHHPRSDNDKSNHSSAGLTDHSQSEPQKVSVQITNLPSYSVLTPKRLYEHLVDSVPNQRSEPLLPYQLNLYRYSRSACVCGELKFHTIVHARNFVERAERSWPSAWYNSAKTGSESRNKQIEFTIISQDHPVTWPSHLETYSVKNRSDSYRPNPRAKEDETTPSENQISPKAPTPHPNQPQPTAKRRSTLVSNASSSSNTARNSKASSAKAQSDCYRPSKARGSQGDRRRFGDETTERKPQSRADKVKMDQRSNSALAKSSVASTSKLRKDNPALPSKNGHDLPSKDRHNLPSKEKHHLPAKDKNDSPAKDPHEFPSNDNLHLPSKTSTDLASKQKSLPFQNTQNVLPPNHVSENGRNNMPPKAATDLPPENVCGSYSEEHKDPPALNTNMRNDEGLLLPQEITMSAADDSKTSTVEDLNTFTVKEKKTPPVKDTDRPSVKPTGSLFAKYLSGCLEQRPIPTFSPTHSKQVTLQTSTSCNVTPVSSSQVSNETNPSLVMESRPLRSNCAEDADLKFLESLFSSEEMKKEAQDRRNSVLLSKLKPSISFSVLQSHFLIPNRPRHFRIFEPVQISYGPFHNLITDHWISSSVNRANHYNRHQNPAVDVGCLISFNEFQTASNFLKVLEENPPFEPIEPVLVDPTTIEFDA